jgi:hypothetical protein
MCILKFSKYGKSKRGRCGALWRKAVPLIDLTLQDRSYPFLRYPRYCRKIFIFNFKAIFISKIGHIYAIEEGLAGEQSALVSVAN